MSQDKISTSSHDDEHYTVPHIETNVCIETEREAASDRAPDGGYGWICLLACFLLNGSTWGICATFGIYLNYYLSTNVFPTANEVTFAFVGGSNFAAALVTAPGVNWLLRRFGTKPVMFAGCLIWLMGFLAASWAREFWQVVLSHGVCVGVGLGLIWQPSTAIVSQWFQRKRSMAQGITSSGSGFLGIAYSAITTHLIKSLGLAWTLRVTGIVSFVILTIGTILIRDRNSVVRPTIHPFDTNILNKYQVWMVLGWTIFNLLGYMVLLYSLSNYGKTIGLNQTQSGVVNMLMNLGIAIGRLFIGVVSDRLGRVTVSGFCAALSGIACFAWWVNAENYGSLLSFACVVGMVFGVFWGTVAPIAAEVVDLKDLPSLLSLIWLTDAAPTLFSEVIALELRKLNVQKPYLGPQIYAGLCYLIAGGFLFELRRHKWGLKVREKNK